MVAQVRPNISVAMLVEAVIAILSMFIAWKGVQLISPWIQTWLKGQDLQIPAVEISTLKQAYYTVITSLRDFPLLRFGVLFIPWLCHCETNFESYWLIHYWVVGWLNVIPYPERSQFLTELRFRWGHWFYSWIC